MEDVTVNKTLQEILKTLKERRNNNVPIIIALIGLFGSLFGYFFNQYHINKRLEKQAEYEFIKSAFENGKTGRERQSNLLFISNFDLVPEHKNKIREGLDNSIISPSGELIFLDGIERTHDYFSLYDMAYELSEAEKYPQTIRVLSKSIELNPNYSESYFLLGYAHLYLEHYGLAIESFNKYEELNGSKNLFYCLLNRGKCFLKLNQNDKACQDFQNASLFVETPNEEYSIAEYLQDCG